ncbi:hypothetical protein [Actinomadura sp. 7K507]|uniref:hypothetical protein n=1 Tax=Actinomadura sp. 7K507 TaxID=2530365 RepID=UPI0010532968|nr:hypothetical protein [Actinomadura sp. 7K507]TDC94911.1 hypothetical protein E1285_08185 [Actinomadura sp. 7K507]
MSEQPGGALDEAAKLFDALIRRVSGGGERDPGRDAGADPGRDVWGTATAEEPRIATGAPECRDCPVCRAIAVRREAGGDVGRHLHEAGQSLMAAALDVVAAFDRTRSDRTRGDRTRRNRPPEPPEASKSARAGRSDRSERPERGDAWSAATDGGPAGIG